jgi:hypothetical protein
MNARGSFWVNTGELYQAKFAASRMRRGARGVWEPLRFKFSGDRSLATVAVRELKDVRYSVASVFDSTAWTAFLLQPSGRIRS